MRSQPKSKSKEVSQQNNQKSSFHENLSSDYNQLMQITPGPGTELDSKSRNNFKEAVLPKTSQPIDSGYYKIEQEPLDQPTQLAETPM